MYNRSNHAVTEDDDFADLGLNDFVSAQRRIASHQLNRRRDRLNVRERGLLGRPLEEWDPEEGSDEASGVIETCMSYASAVGIQSMERDIVMQDDVSLASSFLLFELNVSLYRLKSCRIRGWMIVIGLTTLSTS